MEWYLSITGAGSERSVLYAAWDNDAEIRRAIHELNFGKYAEGGVLYDG